MDETEFRRWREAADDARRAAELQAEHPAHANWACFLAEQLGWRPPRVQPVVWTPVEAREELRRGNPIAVEAVDVGVWLTGSPQLLLQDTEEPSPH